ncbi:hypothetical protein LCGC14_1005960 [marine sediment metagenome]|uniref:Uncharacterized protein n=1 Tax=marine sediment metagenome TaxID=412755 RepID=A0A0F9N6A2_9ZZZZ
MPKYRVKPNHKHWHGGILYQGKVPGKPAEHPDVLDLDEERAGRIANKLELLGAPVLQELASEQSKVEEPEEKAPETESEVSAVPSDSEQAPEDSDKDSEALSATEPKSDKPADESSPLSAIHIGSGKWNVIRDGRSINDVPLTEEVAKALAEGGN